MKLTPYGFFFGLGIFVGSCIIGTYTLKLLGLVLAGIFLQALLCTGCWEQFTFAAVLGSLPILFITFLSDCVYVKRVLFAMALAAAIGRVGCFCVGCCNGPECKSDNELGITYRNCFINKKMDKEEVRVKPTILLEILLQFMLAIAVGVSNYGIVLYGILNMILLYLTNLWRMEKRMGDSTWITYVSLALFSVLSLIKCGKVKGLGKGGGVFSWIYVLAGLLIALQVSNDFTVGAIVRLFTG